MGAHRFLLGSLSSLLLGQLWLCAEASAQTGGTPLSPPQIVEREKSPHVVPPKVLQQVAASYPTEALQRRAHGTVVLKLAVAADGSLGAIEVVGVPDPALAVAAMAALRQWTFAPALRDGQPIAARISVPFDFEVPEPDPEVSVSDAAEAEAPPSAAQATAPAAESPAPAELGSDGAARTVPLASTPAVPASTQTQTETTAPPEVIVTGKRDAQAQPRSASDYHMHRDVLDAAPHAEGAEMLRAAPGLYLARPEGGAVAHRYVLRGFDSDHGQDIEFKVAGMPINLPAHIHGQGYADLGFLIAETVDELRVTEGVHDPRQGDFAVAGSIDVDLAVRERGTLLKAGYGSFGSVRALGLWAPASELPDTFGAFNFESTQGFGPNRTGNGASAVLQYGFSTEHWRYALTGILRAARAQSPGVLRKDDVDAGNVDFYGVYPLPTAEGQNALNQRVLVGVRGAYVGDDGDTGGVGVWASLDDFRLRENYTGFLERSRSLAGVYGRGDLIDQSNLTRSAGLWARYRRSPLRPWQSTELSLEVGLAGRIDQVEQAQDLVDASVRGEIWDHRVDAGITGMDLGGYADLDVHIAEIVRLRVGLRADTLAYDVNDRLGNFAPLSRAQDQYVTGYRRSALGAALGPRASADVDVVSGLTLHAAYGEGFRSPQARLLEDGEQAPFTKVRSIDLGLRYAPVELAHLSLSAYQTNLSDDVAFDAAEGRLERVGRTRRRGAVLEFQATPWTGVVASASCTYVDAELMEPPPPTPENPTPPFKAGQNLPFVPPLVVRADLGASHEVFSETVGRIGLGFSALSARPLPYGESSPAVALFDGSVGARWRMLGLTLEMFNILGSRYSSLELAFPSNWDPEAPASRLPARHQIAGSPRSLMATFEVHL